LRKYLLFLSSVVLRRGGLVGGYQCFADPSLGFAELRTARRRFANAISTATFAIEHLSDIF